MEEVMSEILGAAILGTGDVTGGHIRAYLANPHTEVRALLSRDRDRAEAKARAHGLERCGAYTDLDQLLKRDDIQIVSVCTPHHLHVEQAVACAQAGKHVVDISFFPEDPFQLDALAQQQGVTAVGGWGVVRKIVFVGVLKAVNL
jgi:saccharopine dehydrogenase-like NADP-dependent oxidoreductase